MDGIQSFVIVCRNRDSGAARSLLEIPVKLILQPSHRSGSRHVCSMYEHRCAKVPGREHLSDVPEVTADFVPALGVTDVVGAYIDCATIVASFEMMGGFLV